MFNKQGLKLVFAKASITLSGAIIIVSSFKVLQVSSTLPNGSSFLF